MVHLMDRIKAATTHWTMTYKWEIRQQWTPTPFEDHITISQGLPQEYQLNTTELSFDLHFPNITQQ